MVVNTKRRCRARIAIYGLAYAITCFAPEGTRAQGETTSAILGQVMDASNAAIAGATVTIMDLETDMQRSATTDNDGRFNFPQLKPGGYSVKAEAEGFEP